MKNPKLELGGIALIVIAAGGNALAGDAPAANDPPPPAAQQPAGDDSTPIACPVPNEAGQPGQPGYAAQPAPPPPPPSMAPTPAEVTPAYNWIYDIGLGFAVGGGVDDFVSSTMRNATGVGGSWTARVTVGTHSFLAGEASYIGSAQSISSLGLASNSELIGNGAQAALRLNATTNYPVQPFAYGGLAWRHYSLNTTSPNFSDVADHADALEVPVGIGIAGYVSGLMLDARGEYRFGWTDHDIIPGASGNNAMDRWGVTGNIGYSF
jgi:hypothetical protein